QPNKRNASKSRILVLIMKRNQLILSATICLLVFGFRAAANQIVYPWRACPAIAPVGKTIDILYDNPAALPVDSIILSGPYNRVVLSADTVQSGRFEYDSFTKAAVGTMIRITVPEGTPEELYDLIVKSG